MASANRLSVAANRCQYSIYNYPAKTVSLMQEVFSGAQELAAAEQACADEAECLRLSCL